MSKSQPRAVAPVIETQRLQLRPFVAADLPAFCALWNDEIVYRYISGKPASEEDHWARMLKLVGHWHMVGYGSWAIVEKASGALIGQCGFNDYRRDITPPLTEPEMGWVLRGAAQGQGFGFEATRAALSWLEAATAAPVTACIIDPANQPSLRLAAKLGYKLAAETTYKGKSTQLLRRQYLMIT